MVDGVEGADRQRTTAKQRYKRAAARNRHHQIDGYRARGSALRDQTERSESPHGHGVGAKGGGWGVALPDGRSANRSAQPARVASGRE